MGEADFQKIENELLTNLKSAYPPTQALSARGWGNSSMGKSHFTIETLALAMVRYLRRAEKLQSTLRLTEQHCDYGSCYTVLVYEK